MKPLEFQIDIPSIQDLTRALEGADSDASPRWGRMSAPEMLHHVADFGDLYFGEIKTSLFTRCVARLLGPFFLRTLTNKNPLGGTPRNLRTMPAIKASSSRVADWEQGLKRVRAMLKRLEMLTTETMKHPLYGTMQTADFKALVLHHTAHHFHQFGLI